MRAIEIIWNESWRDVAKLRNHRSDPSNTEGHVWSAQEDAWGESRLANEADTLTDQGDHSERVDRTSTQKSIRNMVGEHESVATLGINNISNAQGSSGNHRGCDQSMLNNEKNMSSYIEHRSVVTTRSISSPNEPKSKGGGRKENAGTRVHVFKQPQSHIYKDKTSMVKPFDSGRPEERDGVMQVKNQ